MNALLRITGIGSLVSLYRYVYLNQPRLTRLAGVALILAVGAIHAIEAPDHFRAAAYLGVLFAVNAAAALVAAVGILRGRKVGAGRWEPRSAASRPSLTWRAACWACPASGRPRADGTSLSAPSP